MIDRVLRVTSRGNIPVADRAGGGGQVLVRFSSSYLEVSPQSCPPSVSPIPIWLVDPPDTLKRAKRTEECLLGRIVCGAEQLGGGPFELSSSPQTCGHLDRPAHRLIARITLLDDADLEKPRIDHADHRLLRHNVERFDPTDDGGFEGDFGLEEVRGGNSAEPISCPIEKIVELVAPPVRPPDRDRVSEDLQTRIAIRKKNVLNVEVR